MGLIRLDQFWRIGLHPFLGLPSRRRIGHGELCWFALGRVAGANEATSGTAAGSRELHAVDDLEVAFRARAERLKRLFRKATWEVFVAWQRGKPSSPLRTLVHALTSKKAAIT